MSEPTVEIDRRPHSRACGWQQHPHGPSCSVDCPTCGKKDPRPSYVLVDSPNADVSGDEPIVTQIADGLERITINYEREGSGPGSRFEGLTLERVQARWVVDQIRFHDRMTLDT